jgi:DNA-directed RNA polymerase specialized sigma24 family protein
MGQDCDSGPDHGQLNLTPWTIVLKAVESQVPGAPQSLAELCEHYWRPLYAYALRNGRLHEDAQDLVQGFFGHLIRRRGLSTVDRAKGRFRDFLLGSFKNLVMADARRAGEEKRDGRAVVIRLDWEDPEAGLGFEPEERLTSETIYDAQWVLVLLRHATERLQQEQSAKGKGETFRTLKGFLGGDGGGRVSMTYQKAASVLGIGVQNVTNLNRRLRQRHEVKRTVLDPAEVEAELHGLCEALWEAGRAGA